MIMILSIALELNFLCALFKNRKIEVSESFLYKKMFCRSIKIFALYSTNIFPELAFLLLLLLF